MSRARMLAAAGTNQQHIRNLNRRFLVHDSALHVLLRIRACVPLDDVGVLHRYRVLPRIHGKHPAGLALVAPRHHLHVVAVTDAAGMPRWIFFSSSHGYHTSGASETILVKFFSRSSLATGPKTRVPTGSFASLINTAALSSNRIYVPSRRRCSFLVRTTTARTTLPFLTWPS